MAEPRARTRTKGHTFDPSNLTDLLFAYGTSVPALPTTLTTLDEILTDFIIETCHYAALSASYSRRQKIKVDDFKFVLRRDERLLGRVLEQLWREKRIKESRKIGDLEALGGVDGVGLGGLAEVAAAGGVDRGEMKERKRGGGRGRGKRKRGDGDDGRAAKRVAS